MTWNCQERKESISSIEFSSFIKIIRVKHFVLIFDLFYMIIFLRVGLLFNETKLFFEDLKPFNFNVTMIIAYIDGRMMLQCSR